MVEVFFLFATCVCIIKSPFFLCTFQKKLLWTEEKNTVDIQRDNPKRGVDVFVIRVIPNKTLFSKNRLLFPPGEGGKMILPLCQHTHTHKHIEERKNWHFSIIIECVSGSHFIHYSFFFMASGKAEWKEEIHTHSGRPLNSLRLSF